MTGGAIEVMDDRVILRSKIKLPLQDKIANPPHSFGQARA